MNALADSLFTALMSWVRALVSDLWAIFSSDRTTILEFFGKNWIILVLLLLAAGLTLDWLIWLIRWQPYHLWARRARRILRIEDEQEEEEDRSVRRAHAARMPERPQRPIPSESERDETWLPLEDASNDLPERQVLEQTQRLPDMSLGAYTDRPDGAEIVPPDSAAQETADAWQEPGEPDEAAWQQEQPAFAAQIPQAQWPTQEESAWQAQTDAAYVTADPTPSTQEEETMRRRQQAEAAEQAQQETEQLRYTLEMAEYNRQMEQYRRDLAEYERQKADYEAQVEAQQQSHLHRTPQTMPQPQDPGEREAQDTPRKTLMDRMVRVMRNLEPEETEVHEIASLPPRVDKHEAYAPAARPPRGSRRRR